MPHLQDQNPRLHLELCLFSHTKGIGQAVLEWIELNYESLTPHTTIPKEAWASDDFLSEYVQAIHICEIEGTLLA